MIASVISVLLLLVVGVTLPLALFFVCAAIAEWFEGRAKLKRYAQQRQREMLHERWVQSDSAMRLIDDMRRQFRDRL